MELIAVNYSAPDSDVQFVESLRETGFGVLKNHPIDQALVNRIYAHWTAFFAGEDKYRYRFNRERQDGYYSQDHAETAKNYHKQDIKEYYHYYPWGQCPEALRPELQEYYEQAHRLAAELLSWIEQHSPPEVSARYSEPLSGMIDGSEQTLLRI
ncbi:MAG: 2-oxoglutarate and iron-dependent oxygenase domain-containing protein, partial [Pseudomonadales bacterium]